MSPSKGCSLAQGARVKTQRALEVFFGETVELAMLRRALTIALAFNAGITGANASPESERATRSCDAKSFVREQKSEWLALSQELDELVVKSKDILQKRGAIADQILKATQNRFSELRAMFDSNYDTDHLIRVDNAL